MNEIDKAIDALFGVEGELDEDGFFKDTPRDIGDYYDLSDAKKISALPAPKEVKHIKANNIATDNSTIGSDSQAKTEEKMIENEKPKEDSQRAQDKNDDFKIAVKSLTPAELINLSDGKIENLVIIGGISPNEIVCPFCGNGTGDSHTGVDPLQHADGTFLYHCFKCGENYDNLDIIANAFCLTTKDNFKQVLSIARNLLDGKLDGLDTLQKNKVNVQNPNSQFQKKPKRNFAQEILLWRRDLRFFICPEIDPRTAPVGIYRGLSYKTLEYFQVGYCANWQKIKSLPFDTERLIIPTSNHHYLARFVGKLDDYSDEQQEKILAHQKVHLGAKEIFPNEFLRWVRDEQQAKKDFDAQNTKQSSHFCGGTFFAVEGEFDAMSGWQVTRGEKFIAFSGSSITKAMQEQLKQLPAPCVFIVIPDNDDAGDKAADSFVATLNSLGHLAIKRYVKSDNDDCKDLNEFLQKYPLKYHEDSQLENKLRRLVFLARAATGFVQNFGATDALKLLDQKEINKIIDSMLDNKISDKCENEKNETSSARQTKLNVVIRDCLKAPNQAQNQPTKQSEGTTPLDAINKEIDAFKALSAAAIERLKDVKSFDYDTVFSTDIIEAAAYAKIFDIRIFSNFALDLKNFGDKNHEQKVNVNDWKKAVREQAKVFNDQYDNLIFERNKILAIVNTKKFSNKFLSSQNFTFPEGYSVTSDGISKIEKNKNQTVCRRPVIITAKTKSIEEKKFKPILSFWTSDGKQKFLPPMPASIVFNRASVVDLRDYGLPTSSHTSSLLVDYLDAFDAANDTKIPTTCTVPRCGWYIINDKDVFVDPRRSCSVTDDDKTVPLVVDDSSTFASTLQTKGKITEWKKAYELVKSSPVARFIVAATVASPLLKVLGERNFLVYLKAHTRAGKTTALFLGASAVGTEKMIRSFDATKNGLLGAAEDVSDYSFLVDEKQVIDNRLSEQGSLIVYALANGIGRLRLDRDSKLKKTADWRTIALMTGETNLLIDTDPEGSYTRLLQLNAPRKIIPADSCKIIRDTIKDNYGLVFPLIIDKIFDIGNEALKTYFSKVQESFNNTVDYILAEHKRYVSVITLADFILNVCLGTDEETAFSDAVDNAGEIFKFIPTKNDIDGYQREVDFLQGFIAQNQSRFIGGNIALEKMQQIFGKIEPKDGAVYITVTALKQACKDSGFNYDKLVDDLIDAKYFIPSDKTPTGYKTPIKTHLKKILKTPTQCYKFFYEVSVED